MPELGRTLDIDSVDVGEDLRNELIETGTVVVRNLFDAAVLREWHLKALEFFEDFVKRPDAEERAAAMDLTDNAVNSGLTGGYLGLRSFSRFVCGESDRVYHYFLDALAEDRILDPLRAVLGGEVRLQVNNLAVRYAHASMAEAGLKYHQDGLGWFLPEYQVTSEPAMLVVFTPLVECDDEHPGLELVTEPYRRILTAKDPEMVAAREWAEGGPGKAPADAPIWHPFARPGDAILFGERTLHRTVIAPDMPYARTSVIMRVFAPSRVPPSIFVAPNVPLPDPARRGIDGAMEIWRNLRADVAARMGAGDYEAAKLILDKVVAARPDIQSWRFLRAQTLASMGRFEEAVTDYSAANECIPRNAPLLLQRARAFRSLGKLRSAIDDLDRAIGIDPDLSDAYILRSNLLASLGQAHPPHPETDPAPDEIGALLRDGRFDAALAAIETRHAGGDGCGALFCHHGEALSGLGRHREAVAAYGEALWAAPRDPSVLLRRARAHSALGRMVFAIDDLDRAIGIDPDQADARALREVLLAEI